MVHPLYFHCIPNTKVRHSPQLQLYSIKYSNSCGMRVWETEKSFQSASWCDGSLKAYYDRSIICAAAVLHNLLIGIGDKQFKQKKQSEEALLKERRDAREVMTSFKQILDRTPAEV
ncbi:unnamed protein product [Phytophthora fragariaefolia]|uniref:Unnamed protein product n=1 Tax=Phytophthora fragariaefolia TaxID=1490495 RepID=A0A9W7D442_9STRA|nr:unnamed protein product [Phytophthora fragariaefolia]